MHERAIGGGSSTLPHIHTPIRLLVPFLLALLYAAAIPARAQAPPTPTLTGNGCDGTATTQTSVRLVWNAPQDQPTGYIVRRQEGADFVAVGWPGADATDCTCTGLDPDTGYTFDVIAYSYDFGTQTEYDSQPTTAIDAATLPNPPDQPQYLYAQATSSTAIHLTWPTPNGTPTGYILTRTDPNNNVTPIPVVGTPNSCDDTGLTPYTYYEYTLVAYNDGGPSGPATTWAQTLPDPPGAPSLLMAAAISASEIDLSWTAGTAQGYMLSYNVWRTTGDGVTGANWACVGWVYGSPTTYSDTSVSAGTQYTYRVSESNEGGTSGWSNLATATTPPYPPDEPQYFCAQATSSTAIHLTWQTPNGSPTNYTLTRTGPDNNPIAIPVVGTPNSCDDTGLMPYRYYEYTLVAYNDGGPSGPATTWAQTLPDPPGAPSLLMAAAISASEIDLSWTAGTAQGAMLSYNVWRTTGDGVTGTNWACVGWVYGSSTTYADTSVSAGMQYTYRVSESNEGGTSGWSNLATATTLPYPPDEPQYFYAQPTSSSAISLSWQTPNGSPTSYSLTRIGPDNIPITIGPPGPGDTSYTDTPLSSCTYYSYSLVASNTGGDSSPATTGAQTAPQAPTGLTLTSVTTSEVDLEWTGDPNGQGGMSSYNVWRTAGDGVTGTNWACVGWAYGSTTTYADTSVSANTEYAYYVTESNEGGTSGPSNIVNTAAALGMPQGFTAQGVSMTEIDLSWQTPDDVPTGYTLTRTNPDSSTTVFPPGGTATSYSDTDDLQPGISYSYALVANNNGTDSPPATAVGTTLPAPPAVPTLSADNVTDTEVDLGWWAEPSAGGPASTYTVWRTDGDGVTGVDFQPVDTCADPTTTWSDTTVSPGTTYTYQVTASNASGTSDPSSSVTVTTLFPGQPANFQADAASSSEIDLTWQAPSGVPTGYTVTRTNPDATTTELYPGATDTSLNDTTDLVPFSTYSYSLVANFDGWDAQPVTAAAATLFPVPIAPTGLTIAAATAYEVDLQWAGDTTALGDVKWYSIWRTEGNGTTDPSWSLISWTIDPTTTYQDTDVDGNTQYSYKVAESNEGGSSGFSDVATTSVLPPAAPWLSVDTVTDTEVDLSWVADAGGSGLAETYTVWRTEGDGVANADFQPLGTTDGPAETWADTTVDAGTAYAYEVTASSASGTSAPSNDVPATTLLPGQPPDFQAEGVSASEIDLAWQTPDGSPTGYTLTRTNPDGSTVALLAGAESTSLNDTSSLAPFTAYSYSMVAHFAGDDSQAEVAYAMTKPVAPGPPSGLTITATMNSEVDIQWTGALTGQGASRGYTVWRTEGVGGNDAIWAAIGWTDDPITLYADTSVSPGTQYSYEVAETNEVATSAFSNVATTTTPAISPGEPAGFTASGVSSSEIDLAWETPDGGVTGYTATRTNPDATTTEFYPGASDTGLNDTTDLTPYSTYIYSLVADFDAGDSQPTTAGAKTLPDPPNAPGGLVATPMSNSEVDLSWAEGVPAAQGDYKGYGIWRAAGDGGTDATWSEIGWTDGATTSYQDTDVSGGAEYSYEITESNEAGDSGPSNVAQATTPPYPPDQPLYLWAEPASSSEIDVTWDTPDGIPTSYTLTISGPNGDTTVNLGASETSYSDVGLDPYTEYAYSLVAQNAGGNSDPGTAMAQTLALTPSAPAGLAATPISNGEVDLSWSEGAPVAQGDYKGYGIWRADGAGGDDAAWSEIGWTDGSTTTYQDTNVNPGTQYSYEVTESNEAGDSEPSNVASATTPPDQPTGFSAQAVSASEIKLTWQPPDGTITGYALTRTDPDNNSTTFYPLATDTSYDDTACPASDTYYSYSIVAQNTGGGSAPTTVGAQTPVAAPKVPTGLSVTHVTASEVDLSWMGDSTAEGYNKVFDIYRAPGDGTGTPSWTLVGWTSDSNPEYQDTSVSAGTQYAYHVRETNEGGSSPPDGPVTATTPPAQPLNFWAQASSSSTIHLTWQAPSGLLTGYTLTRTGPDDIATPIGPPSVGAAIYDDTTCPAPYTCYSYALVAYNAGGDSDPATEGAQTLPDPPDPPNGLQATAISQSEIDLQWIGDCDAQGYMQVYDIYRAQGDGTGTPTWTLIGWTTDSTTPYQDTSVNANTQYAYEVEQVSEGGPSQPAGPVVATTLPYPPGPPTNFQAQGISTTEIKLTWQAPSGPVTGYTLTRTDEDNNATAFELDGTPTEYDDPDLSHFTSYSYALKAHNGAGESQEVMTTGMTLPAAPAAPGNLSVNRPWGQNQELALTWTGDGSALGYSKVYHIWRTQGNGGEGSTWTCIGQTYDPNTGYTDQGLDGNATYSYYVTESNEGGTSGPSITVTGNTGPWPTDDIPYFNAEVVSATQINLTWKAPNGDITGYTLTSDHNLSVSPDPFSFSDTSLQPYTYYEYTLVAHKGDDTDDPPAAHAMARTLPLVASKPDNLMVNSVTAEDVDLSWTGDGTAQGDYRCFEIWRTPGDGVTGVNWTYAGYTYDATPEYDDVGVSANTQYTYKVREWNEGGESAWSDTVTTTTIPYPPDQPASFTAQATSPSEIDLSWQTPSGPLTGYTLTRTGPDNIPVTIDPPTVGDTTYKDDTGLSPFTEYSYSLVASNTGGDSSAAPAMAQTLPNPPAAPKDLIVTTLTPYEVDLAWTGDPYALGYWKSYQIERTIGNGTDNATWIGIGWVNDGMLTTYNDTTVTGNTQYTYRVNETNEGGTSDWATWPPLSTPPAATLTIAPTTPPANGNAMLPADGVSTLPLTVTAVDGTDAPLSGATVNVTVTTGMGTVQPSQVTTGTDGTASVTLTAGTTGGTATVTAALASVNANPETAPHATTTVTIVKAQFGGAWPLLVAVGDTATVSVTVTPTSAASSVQFDTLDTSIATVTGDATGLTLGGVATGTTTLRATMNGAVVDVGTVDVVKIASLQYQNPDKTWSDATAHTLYVPVGSTVTFKAAPSPGSVFPATYPVWGGAAHGDTGTSAKVTFSDPSESATDFQTVTADCGNSLVANVIAFTAALQVRRSGPVDTSGQPVPYGPSATVAAGGNQGTPSAEHIAEAQLVTSPPVQGIGYTVKLVGGDGVLGGAAKWVPDGTTTNSDGVINGKMYSSNLTEHAALKALDSHGAVVGSVDVNERWNDFLDGGSWVYDDLFYFEQPSQVTFKPRFADGDAKVPITGHTTNFLVVSYDVWQWNDTTHNYRLVRGVGSATVPGLADFSPGSGGDAAVAGSYTSQLTVHLDPTGHNLVDTVYFDAEDDGVYVSR